MIVPHNFTGDTEKGAASFQERIVDVSLINKI